MTRIRPACSIRDTATEPDVGPLWSQAEQSLLKVLSNNALGIPAALPSESALCERFGVSRTVVCEALNQLVYGHVIYKRQGKDAPARTYRPDCR